VHHDGDVVVEADDGFGSVGRVADRVGREFAARVCLDHVLDGVDVRGGRLRHAAEGVVVEHDAGAHVVEDVFHEVRAEPVVDRGDRTARAPRAEHARDVRRVVHHVDGDAVPRLGGVVQERGDGRGSIAQVIVRQVRPVGVGDGGSVRPPPRLPGELFVEVHLRAKVCQGQGKRLRRSPGVGAHK